MTPSPPAQAHADLREKVEQCRVLIQETIRRYTEAVSPEQFAVGFDIDSFVRVSAALSYRHDSTTERGTDHER